MINNGFTVQTAGSGYEAIEYLKANSVNMILSDFRMPNGNGMSVLNFVQTLNPRPVFFFVSGQSDVSIEDCIKAGAQRFFAKPFELDEIILEINQLQKGKHDRSG